MKYIEAEQLKAEIDKRLKKISKSNTVFTQGKRDAYNNLLSFLDTLPEQPVVKKSNALFDECVENCDPAIMKEVSDNIDKLLGRKPVEGLEEEMFKEWGTTKEEYLAKSMDKVHLEMEITTYLQDWEDDDEIGLHLSTDEGCMPIELEDVRVLARHFAEWGKNNLK